MCECGGCSLVADKAQDVSGSVRLGLGEEEFTVDRKLSELRSGGEWWGFRG